MCIVGADSSTAGVTTTNSYLTWCQVCIQQYYTVLITKYSSRCKTYVIPFALLSGSTTTTTTMMGSHVGSRYITRYKQHDGSTTEYVCPTRRTNGAVHGCPLGASPFSPFHSRYSSKISCDLNGVCTLYQVLRIYLVCFVLSVLLCVWYVVISYIQVYKGSNLHSETYCVYEYVIFYVPDSSSSREKAPFRLSPCRGACWLTNGLPVVC